MTSNSDFDLSALEDELTPPQAGTSDPKANQDAQAGAAGTASDSDELLETPDGRKVSPKEMARLWRDEFYPEYTKKSQKLSELEEAQTSKQSSKTEQPDGTELNEEDQAVAKEIDRIIKHTKFGQSVALKEDVEAAVPRAAQVGVAQIELQKALTDLASDFDGSVDPTVGIQKPKVDPRKIVEYIRENRPQNMSPLQIARNVYYDDFAKYEGAVMNRGTVKAELPDSEKGGTSGGGSQAPQTQKYDFNDNMSALEEGVASILNNA